jgi:hypothetical protein
MNKNAHDSPSPDRKYGLQTRRGFLFAGVVFLIGCGTKRATSSLPSPIWSGSRTLIVKPTPPVAPTKSTISIGAISRSTWAMGQPIPKNMNPMKPARYITIHHDGMTSFTSTSKSEAAERLETIRKAHLRRVDGRWGDIGYHYAIDPAGRLWEGRSLKWQGAHVKSWNEGNIGVVVLGNYEKQSLNRAQSARIEATLKILMKKHSVPVSRVLTHKEWAPTACPGKSLQRLIKGLRRSALKKV